jgi:hypothetical protein
MGYYTWQGHAEKAMHRSGRRLRKLLTKPPAPVQSATGYRLHNDPANGRCVGWAAGTRYSHPKVQANA